jgi:RimJ/RimL family protein N-acetyltransferase
MPSPLQTKRLLLRPLAASDYDFMRTIHTDPLVMKYIGGGSLRTETQTFEMIEKVLRIEKECADLGAWIAVLRETGEPIGNFILRIPATSEKTEGLEIGYSITPSYWGKGYTVEACQGILEYAFQELKVNRVVALIHATHDASRRVLEKLNFTPAGTTMYVDPATGNQLPTDVLELRLLP